MEIILKENIENLGYADDIVNVKPGYARNYLIPQLKAVVANTTNRKQLAERLKYKQKKETILLGQIQELIDVLKKASIKIGAKVGTTEKIFGSITTHHLAEAIKDQTGVDVDRRKIVLLSDEIKTLGSYGAKIQLHKDHAVEIAFTVVAE